MPGVTVVFWCRLKITYIKCPAHIVAQHQWLLLILVVIRRWMWKELKRFSLNLHEYVYLWQFPVLSFHLFFGKIKEWEQVSSKSSSIDSSQRARSHGVLLGKSRQYSWSHPMQQWEGEQFMLNEGVPGPIRVPELQRVVNGCNFIAIPPTNDPLQQWAM